MRLLDTKRAVMSLLCLLVFPAWSQATGSAYSLTYQKDIPLALAGVGFFALGQYRISNMEPYDGNYEKIDLMPWDRPIAGHFNAKADLASDILSGAGVYPVVFALAGWHRGDIQGRDVATQVGMLAEALAIQSGINLAVRSLKVWPRPLMLGTDGGEERNSADASGSFYSGHSSAAFTIAVFSGCWFDRTYPDSKWTPWVWAGGLALATTTASLRVVAGKHYPSDIIVGALMGSLVGWVVPYLHRNLDDQQRVTAVAMPNGVRVLFVL